MYDTFITNILIFIRMRHTYAFTIAHYIDRVCQKKFFFGKCFKKKATEYFLYKCSDYTIPIV